MSRFTASRASIRSVSSCFTPTSTSLLASPLIYFPSSTSPPRGRVLFLWMLGAIRDRQAIYHITASSLGFQLLTPRACRCSLPSQPAILEARRQTRLDSGSGSATPKLIHVVCLRPPDRYHGSCEADCPACGPCPLGGRRREGHHQRHSLLRPIAPCLSFTYALPDLFQ